AVFGMALTRRYGQSKAKRFHHAHEGGHTRIAFFAESFVERRAGDACLLGDGCRASGAGDVAKGMFNQGGIAIFECGFDIGEDSLFAVEVFGDIPFGFKAHQFNASRGSIPSSTSRSVPQAATSVGMAETSTSR